MAAMAEPKRQLLWRQQDGAFVVRLFQGGQSGGHHVLAEFTRDDIAELVTRGPALRAPAPKPTPA